MSYTELTVWTRGIIMDKEGRDIVNSVAAAGRIEGKFSQAMENYVDNPDRTNAPTRKYCRISDSEIENALTYENEHPNIVVLVEQTMVKGWDYMRGMPPGGTLVINTHYSPDYMIRFVPGPERLAQLVCVDAAKLADHKWLYYRLGELGLDRLVDGRRGRAQQGDRARYRRAADRRSRQDDRHRQDRDDRTNDCEQGGVPRRARPFARPAAQSGGGLRRHQEQINEARGHQEPGTTRIRSSCPPKARTSLTGCRFRLRASRRRLPRKKARICFRRATGARFGPCIATRCRRATTRAARTKRSRAISIS